MPYPLAYSTIGSSHSDGPSPPTLGIWPAHRFALLVVSLLLAQTPALPRLAAQLRQVTPGALADSIERRLRRALSDAWLSDPQVLFVPLAQQALAYLPAGPCYLLLDDTPQTDTGAQVTLLARAYGGRSLPLAWGRGVGPLQEGDYWQQVDPVFCQARTILPPQVQPVLLADRGISCGALARLAQAHGWHYLLRLPGDCTFRPAGPDGVPSRGSPRRCLAALVPTPGSRFAAPRRFFARHCLDACFVGGWLSGHTEPWLLLTNLGPDPTLVGRYAYRMKVGSLFRDTKSDAFQWEAGRLLETPRAERLFLALMTALLCATLLGEATHRAGEVPAYGWRAQAVSLVRRGLDWLATPARPRSFHWTLIPGLPLPPKSVRR